MSEELVTWSSREPPLDICGVFGEGASAVKLAARLSADEQQVDVFLGNRALVAIGEPDDLPWVDNATWLGRDGSLLCPTTLRPNVPAALLVAAIRRAGEVDGVAVSTPDRALVLRRPPGAFDRAALADFVERSNER